MATVNLYPDATSDSSNWTIVGGGTHHSATQTYDAGSNYVQIDQWNFNNNNLIFGVDTMPLNNGGSLTVTAFGYMGRNQTATGEYRGWWVVDSTSYSGADTTFPVSWNLHETTPSSPPSMTAAKIDDASNSFGVRNRNGGGNDAKRGRMEQFYLTVDYTPAAGLQVIAWAIPLMGIISSHFILARVVNSCRRRQICHRHGMPVGTCRQSILGNRDHSIWPVDVTYTRQELESLQREYRDSLRGYAFMGEAAWLSM